MERKRFTLMRVSPPGDTAIAAGIPAESFLLVGWTGNP